MSALRTILAPRMWGAHLLMVVVVTAAVALGVWQYNQFQEAKDAQVDDLAHAQPKPLGDVFGPNDAFPGFDLGRPVVVEGTWSQQGTVLVKGEERHGRQGYWVLSPVIVDGTQSALPVVRGWTPSRERVPQPPTGHTKVVGWLQPPQQDAVTDDDTSDDVLPQVDVTLLLDRVDADLYSGFVVAAGQEKWPVTPVNDGSRGLAPVAAPAPPEPDSSTGLRNLLYAIEWWLFAVFGVYIWVRHLRDAIAGDGESDRADVARAAEDEDGACPADESATDQAVPSGS